MSEDQPNAPKPTTPPPPGTDPTGGNKTQYEPTQKSAVPAPPPLPGKSQPQMPVPPTAVSSNPVTASTQPAPPPTAATMGGGTGGSTGKVLVMLGLVCFLFLLAVGGLAWYFLLYQPVQHRADATVPLLIDATPWGEVTRVTDAEGTEIPLPAEAMEAITPLTLNVPPGEYTVQIRHPWSGAEGECRVRLSENRQEDRCLVSLITLNAEDYFVETGWGKGGGR